jgi:galactose mutarotase-like enzyme
MATNSPTQFIIKNEYLTVEIKKLGAELCSVIDKNGTQFMWQAEEVWPRHAPNLFPIIGSLLDHEYSYNGKTYPLSHHGFARNIYFDMLHQSEHSIALVLQQNDETFKMYPFSFTLIITYFLSKNSLKQTFRVINNDASEMPVSFGGHPAFNANPISEHSIVFDTNETNKSNTLQGPYISNVEYDIIKGNTIELNNHIFDNDALIFQNLDSKTVSLVHNNEKYKVTIDISEFPYLGIWAKPKANYVCIEPWQGLADFVNHDKKIENKKGVVWIPVNQEITKSFTMTFQN